MTHDAPVRAAAGRSSRRTGAVPLAITVAAATGWALVAAWTTPRGPVTTAQALIAVAVRLAGSVAALVESTSAVTS